MLVKDRMTPDPICIKSNESFHDALRRIRENKVCRLPVVDQEGKLVGIVSEKDLLYTSPSPSASLSAYEINYLLAKMRVEQVMTRPVVTVDENLPLEEAARTMIDQGIGSLVVTHEQDMVGIITETDIFEVFVEMLGGGHPSTRVTVRVVEQKGSLADLAGRIAAAGGNIHSLATFAGDDPEHRFIAARVEDIDPELIASEQIELINVWRAEQA